MWLQKLGEGMSSRTGITKEREGRKRRRKEETLEINKCIFNPLLNCSLVRQRKAFEAAGSVGIRLEWYALVRSLPLPVVTKIGARSYTY